jgi:hypothetical protein
LTCVCRVGRRPDPGDRALPEVASVVGVRGSGVAVPVPGGRVGPRAARKHGRRARDVDRLAPPRPGARIGSLRWKHGRSRRLVVWTRKMTRR